MGSWEGVLAVLGLMVLTITTRGAFFLLKRELPIPQWLQQGLRYAPLAAMAAVVLPEVLMTRGQLMPKGCMIFLASTRGIMAGMAPLSPRA